MAGRLLISNPALNAARAGTAAVLMQSIPTAGFPTFSFLTMQAIPSGKAWTLKPGLTGIRNPVHEKNV
jgi:hypothetical protein